MITLWQSMNPILQLAWLPILGVLAAMAGWGIFDALKGFAKTAAEIADSEKETFDSSWMSVEKYIGLK